MTSVNIVANQTENMSNINQNPEYSLTNGYDFIGVVISANSDTPEGAEMRKRPFWGSVDKYGPCIKGVGRMHWKQYYIFWVIPNGKSDVDIVPCAS